MKPSPRLLSLATAALAALASLPALAMQPFTADYRASFMGLTEEQAELACRRLTARAVPCETVGG